MGMKLYGYWRSSSAWRVRIALEMKGLVYEHVPVHLLERGGHQHSPLFAEMNPMSQVPVLEVHEDGNQLSITQSMAIIEYLEERFGEPLLLPSDALARARAREFAEIVNSGIQPFHNSGFHTELKRLAPNLDSRRLSKRYIEKGLRALELLALPVARRYALGDAPTLADLYLVPQLYQARRYEVDPSPFPTLVRIERTCQELPAFQRAHPDNQPDAEQPAKTPASGKSSGLPSPPGTK